MGVNVWSMTVARYTKVHEALEAAAAAAADLASQASGTPDRGTPFLSAPRCPTVPQEVVLLHCTALHLAAIYGHVAIVQALLASPACSPAACNAMVRGHPLDILCCCPSVSSACHA